MLAIWSLVPLPFLTLSPSNSSFYKVPMSKSKAVKDLRPVWLRGYTHLTHQPEHPNKVLLLLLSYPSGWLGAPGSSCQLQGAFSTDPLSPRFNHFPRVSWCVMTASAVPRGLSLGLLISLLKDGVLVYEGFLGLGVRSWGKNTDSANSSFVQRL